MARISQLRDAAVSRIDSARMLGAEVDRRTRHIRECRLAQLRHVPVVFCPAPIMFDAARAPVVVGPKIDDSTDESALVPRKPSAVCRRSDEPTEGERHWAPLRSDPIGGRRFLPSGGRKPSVEFAITQIRRHGGLTPTARDQCRNKNSRVFRIAQSTSSHALRLSVPFVTWARAAFASSSSALRASATK